MTKKYLASVLLLSAAGFLPMRSARAQRTAPAGSDQEAISRVPANPSLPSIFIVGDSTADVSIDRNHEGLAGVQGWGVFFSAFFDANQVNIVDVARAGRSSRTYRTEGYWDKVMSQLKPRDLVLIQLGQNDVFPINDTTRARGTLPGTGDESQEIDNMLTHKHETVHTFGWYIRKYVQEARSKGAIPIVMSPTPGNKWKDGHIEVGANGYREWAGTIAEQEHVAFVDVNGIIAQQFEKFGQAKVNGLFHAREPVHMTTPGSFLAAECTLAGLKALPGGAVTPYLSTLGRFVPSVAELAMEKMNVDKP